MYYRAVLFASLLTIAFSAYEDEKYYRTPPPPRILSHKQAQNHDGGFKFAFAAENGLAQTEVIAPDGSRNGGYSYVDPHGKTITVKYTAGKEGFRILEGEHISREVLTHHSQPHQRNGPHDDGSYSAQKYEDPYNNEAPAQQAAPKQAYFQYQQPAYHAQPQQHKVRYIQEPTRHQPRQEYQLQPYAQNQPQPQQLPQLEYLKPAPYAPPQPRQYPGPQEPISNAVDTDDPKAVQYNDQPGKAHSFGTGYSFHFSN